jgi:hypothetical protein
MIRHQLEKQGFRISESAPDILVSFTFDVVPAGSVSSAYTFINRAPQAAYIWAIR